MPEYARSIRHLLQLKYEIPSRLRDLLKPRRQRLRELADGFKAVSADMKIWTFLETADSEISIADTLIHVPITSIRSGVLDLEHEKEIPLVTDHRGAAYFKGQESTMRFSFIKAVNLTLIRAVELSAEPDIPLQVEKEVVVQINGFFEDTALGVSDDTPLKLWSTKVSLHDYLAKGPAACLRERIRSNDQLQPGSGDDTSLSEFDSQTPILHASPASDVDSNSVASSDHATDSQSGSSSRSSIKKRRRFFTRPSPSIHITGASDHSDSDARPKSSGEHSLDRTEENSESENSSGGGNMILKKLRLVGSRTLDPLLTCQAPYHAEV